MKLNGSLYFVVGHYSLLPMEASEHFILNAWGECSGWRVILTERTGYVDIIKSHHDTKEEDRPCGHDQNPPNSHRETVFGGHHDTKGADCPCGQCS